MGEKDLYIKVKNFPEVYQHLKDSYKSIPLLSENYFPINGFGMLPVKRKDSFLIVGNPEGLDKFLKENKIETIKK